MPLGEETQKNHQRRIDNGDYDKYFLGKGLDIGYAGYRPDTIPVAGAIGIDTHTPGYDGIHLPFDDESIDFVHSSHCLEHIPDENMWKVLHEWYRVLKVGGYMILTVPHRDLYEKRRYLPSKWNRDHKRFYTPRRLLDKIEFVFRPNTYRVERLIDNDLGFDYTKGPNEHSHGCYEIELILKKISPPAWEIK